MADDPLFGDVSGLKAQPIAWRRRVGSYRIFYDIYPAQFLIAVAAIQRRTSTY